MASSSVKCALSQLGNSFFLLTYFLLPFDTKAFTKELRIVLSNSTLYLYKCTKQRKAMKLILLRTAKSQKQQSMWPMLITSLTHGLFPCLPVIFEVTVIRKLPKYAPRPDVAAKKAVPMLLMPSGAWSQKNSSCPIDAKTSANPVKKNGIISHHAEKGTVSNGSPAVLVSQDTCSQRTPIHHS